MSGELATQTPPWPTAMPEGMFSPSAKTVNRSALPSPSVSSRILTRSRPGPGSRRGILEALGDPDPPALVEGHRHRVDDVGLAGDDLDPEPRRDGHRLDRLVGRSWRVGGRVLRVGNELGSRGRALGAGRPSDERKASEHDRRHEAEPCHPPCPGFRLFPCCTQEFATRLFLHHGCIGLSRGAGIGQNTFMADELWRPSLDLALHRNRQSPQCRFVQLASVREDGRPAVRTIVFRGFLGDTNRLTFATDGRSVKAHELECSNRAEACWYFHATREQFRLAGTVTLVGAGPPRPRSILRRGPARDLARDVRRVEAHIHLA